MQFRQPAVASSTGLRMAADISSTVAELQGPVMYWGSAGVLLGHEESDIKGYDNFTKLTAALKATGLADTLSKGGPYTVFAPTDKAFDDFKGEVTADILKNHVVEGKVSLTSITGDLKAISGKTLKYGRRFRKTFLDEAMVGIVSAGASKGQTYPCDVECSNGVIHAIDVVLVPQ
jgi:uncharacterized surface protein with fasciclin (FAS1) repeats